MENPEIMGAVVGALGTIGTVAVALTNIKTSFKKEVDEKIESAIRSARDLANADINSLNLRIESVSRDIENLEHKIESDIDHVKSIYNGEIRSLAEKIEGLREEVRHQHAQLVALLTKLVSDR